MPTKIYENLPDCYSRDPSTDLYKVLSGLAVALTAGETAIDDFIDDQNATVADGNGLLILGENLNAPKPPTLPEAQYAIMVPILAGAARGTIQAIRAVFEAATGLSGVLVEDQQTNGVIPNYEIWIWVRGDSQLYAGFAEDYLLMPLVRPNIQNPWPPEDCCYMGAQGDYLWQAQDWVHDAFDQYGAEYNDHWWADVDKWTDDIVKSVRLAGTIIIYKLVP